MKDWVDIREKKTGRVLRVIYNPYHKPVKQILREWISEEYLHQVYGVQTNYKR